MSAADWALGILAFLGVTGILPITLAYYWALRTRVVLKLAVDDAAMASRLADAQRLRAHAHRAGQDVRLAGRDPAARPPGPARPEPRLTRPGRAGQAYPDLPGYVIAMCGHRLTASEWKAGYTSCERCEVDAVLSRPPVPLHPVPDGGRP